MQQRSGYQQRFHRQRNISLSEFSQKQKLFLFAQLVLFICFVYILSVRSDVPFNQIIVNSSLGCTDTLVSMARGKWTPREFTDIEQYEVERFLNFARGKYFLPTNLARPDGRCGNVSFDFLKKFHLTRNIFRVLCDPHGPIPCCYDNVCADKTVEECTCSQCYDLRRPVNAELAVWTTENPKCEVKYFDTEAACNLLEGMTVYYVGDSFLRHVYTVTVALLTGNYENATLKADLSNARMTYCRGWMQLQCYGYIDYEVPVCDGRAVVVHKELLVSSHLQSMLSLLKAAENVNRTFFFVGIGIHGWYNERDMWTKFLKPVTDYLTADSARIWPKFIWVSPHAHGVMQSDEAKSMSRDSVIRYNTYINRKLVETGVPLLETFDLTDGVMSYDGAHYGFGVNMLKSQIILSYLHELANSGQL